MEHDQIISIIQKLKVLINLEFESDLKYQVE